MTIMSNYKIQQTKESESDEEVEDLSEDGKDSEREESNDEDDENNDNVKTNVAWANSIAKILKTNKPKKKKSVVLSKAKKLTDVKPIKIKPAGFEVETQDGEIKEEKIIEEQTETINKEPSRKKKKVLPNLRVKPNILEKDRERTLNKIATKGVVQLFNAVRMQQKEIKNKLQEAGPLEVRKEKVLKNVDKRAFLDVLMGEKSLPVEDSNKVEKKEENEKTWSVLRDDFMMGAKLKDWDKEMEMEEEME